MTDVVKFSADVLGWQRKPGPLNVWRVVEGRQKTKDGKTLRFSIQEIPEDRKLDVLNHILNTFTQDEPECRSLGTINNPMALEDFRNMWSFALGQGIVVGAFLIDENNPKPILAGANMTVVCTEATKKGFASGVTLKSADTHMVLRVEHEMKAEKDAEEVYNVDKYISAYGLSVDPRFRGQGIAYELLRARDDMALAYGIEATSNFFTGPSAQHLAAKNGFELLIEREYATFRKEDGSPCFPGIESKYCKLMGKRF